MGKEYTKTNWVNGSEPDIDADHLNNIENGIAGLYKPEFDDSGIVNGITSFPEFLNKVISKMNPFEFYKNFKAGMKFVLHTGQLVNNGLCNEPGKYPLDAAYGKTLKDAQDKINSDLDGIKNRIPSGRTIVYKSFVIPKQEMESGIFDINSFIPSTANWASVCAANGTNSPSITGTIKGVDNHWKIITKELSTGNFTVSALYII